MDPKKIFNQIKVKTIDINEIFETNDSHYKDRGSSANWKSVINQTAMSFPESPK